MCKIKHCEKRFVITVISILEKSDNNTISLCLARK